MQSLYLKKAHKSLLILFFYSMSSENPFCWTKAFYKYSLEVIFSPVGVTNCKEKSLTTQQKLGKYSAKSYGSSY
jgi:hypothetical protein